MNILIFSQKNKIFSRNKISRKLFPEKLFPPHCGREGVIILLYKNEGKLTLLAFQILETNTHAN
jgi:hypothetical protein